MQTVTYASAPTDITTTGPSPALASQTNNTPVIYTHQGTVVQSGLLPGELIFSVTFTAASLLGYYYSSIPTFTLTTGTPSYNNYYTISEVAGSKVNDTNNNLIEVTFEGYYSPPIAPTTPAG